jgi:hypothetical protein
MNAKITYSSKQIKKLFLKIPNNVIPQKDEFFNHNKPN